MVKRTKRIKRVVERKFCVINHTTPHACNRTIKDTELEAIEYAKTLIRGERGKEITLYVVEIKKVVTTGEMPVKVFDLFDWNV